METKICTSCEQELPLSSFVRVKGGGLSKMCRQCRSESFKDGWATKKEKLGGGGKLPPFSDPDFDGKEPGEVIRLMGRAQRWLESRGYTIRLDGEYTETKVHKLKF